MLARIHTWASFVRFSHSVFALPFALTGALLASRITPVGWWQVVWIVVAMLSARSAAMGFNRVVDAWWDARNPRTAGREIPRGAISRSQAIVWVVAWSGIFVLAAGQLNRFCLALSPLALAIVFWYSLAKRYTTWAQAFLGLAMAVAPVGGWLAAGGRGGWEPWLLALAIGLWVGGFDVLYACQDLEFDRAHGLRSIPVRFGVGRSLAISRAMHASAVMCLAAIALVVPLGPIYLAGVAAVGLLLIYEQSLVSATDLSQVKQAFDLNGYVGILYFLVTAVAVYVRS
ncbi:MAG TPA: UbiA-like polyprenyltransferase [Vicinamibacterales bacterium]|nr:UbiA-like polyprenyltransferase [Vicinamibacterales bacterium]